eukprot:6474949-Amphidinium_carterae.2
MVGCHAVVVRDELERGAQVTSSVVKLLFALVAGATDSVRDSGTGGSVVEATTVRGGKADVVVTATIGAEGISDVTSAPANLSDTDYRGQTESKQKYYNVSVQCFDAVHNTNPC